MYLAYLSTNFKTLITCTPLTPVQTNTFYVLSFLSSSGRDWNDLPVVADKLRQFIFLRIFSKGIYRTSLGTFILVKGNNKSYILA